MSGHAGLARWHDYMMGGSDPAVLSALLADDAVFHSPVVHTPQAGKAIVMAYLVAAAEVEVLLEGEFLLARLLVARQKITDYIHGTPFQVGDSSFARLELSVRKSLYPTTRCVKRHEL